MNNSVNLPILYSLRHCPYAMRARIVIFKTKQKIILRDVDLRNKPADMLIASPKGTVPILVTSPEVSPQIQTDNTAKAPSPFVLEESLDIMMWAIKQSDPNNLSHRETPNALNEMLDLINIFDNEFKTCLEQYKCAKRYHESNLEQQRAACTHYLDKLEVKLDQHAYLMSEHESLADLALLPFIRQFAKVERQWYLQSPYPNLKRWLNHYLQSRMFSKVMTKYPFWLDTQDVIIFGDV
ncbi:glutathione S-transferase [Algibacillus agarilyticus]|uniref:glutathione S-transferase n=1 Tax=Algibacillus agarilyticus TaxID=2234133 RepID=UPI000DD00DDD|nr:glutathione S-transferase [Algibacillus agarilyticus]